MNQDKKQKLEEIKDLLLSASPEYKRGESYMFLSKKEVGDLIRMVEEICKMED